MFSQKLNVKLKKNTTCTTHLQKMKKKNEQGLKGLVSLTFCCKNVQYMRVEGVLNGKGNQYVLIVKYK